jgi:hypothetical protein
MSLAGNFSLKTRLEFLCRLKSKAWDGCVLINRAETLTGLIHPLEERIMKKLLFVTLTLVLISAFFAGSASRATAKEPKILEFDTMVGVPAGLTGAASQPVLRGIRGGGLPWMLTSAHGELTTSGHLEIEVQGLVLAAGANTGSNPAAVFRGLVSCLGSDGTPHNILTVAFPATTGPASAGGGNAKIETTVDLPETCIAPIIFVTNDGGSWFAATGY